MRGGRGLAWSIVLAIDLAILGLLFLGEAIAQVMVRLQPDSALAREYERAAAQGADPVLLTLNMLVILVMAGLVPLAWVAGTRVKPWEGTLRYLGLRKPASGFAWGILWGLAGLVAAAVVGYLYLRGYSAATGVSMEQAEAANESPLGEALAAAVTPGLALLIAACAAFGEEVLFRGVVQRKLGLWGQAAVFGIVHMGYGTVLQVLVPFLLGLGFGYLYKRSHNLWIPIGAHFTFNFVGLVGSWYCGENPGLC